MRRRSSPMVSFRCNIWASLCSCPPLPPCDFRRIPFRNEEVSGSIPLRSTNPNPDEHPILDGLSQAPPAGAPDRPARYR
jgi:hypothetical protein